MPGKQAYETERRWIPPTQINGAISNHIEMTAHSLRGDLSLERPHSQVADPKGDAEG